MLHWIYIAIMVLVLSVVLTELFKEQKWRSQIAYAIILIPLILRILHIK